MIFNYKDIKLYYEKFGNKDNTIIILPGWGETKNTFNEIINILKIDYTVYIIDYPGFGNTKFPDYDLTIYDYAKIIKSFITNLNINKPSIIAHSFGGRIAILLSSLYKVNINKLILIDIAGIKPKLTLKRILKKSIYKLLQNLADLLPKNLSNKFKAYLFRKFSSSDYLNLPIKMRKTFQNIVNEDLKCYLDKIKFKTLILWGEDDLDTPLKDAKIIKNKITDSELISFPNCTHFCYLENTYVILRIILAFLED